MKFYMSNRHIKGSISNDIHEFIANIGYTVPPHYVATDPHQKSVRIYLNIIATTCIIFIVIIIMDLHVPRKFIKSV